MLFALRRLLKNIKDSQIKKVNYRKTEIAIVYFFKINYLRNEILQEYINNSHSKKVDFVVYNSITKATNIIKKHNFIEFDTKNKK